MTCREVSEFLDDYISGELPPDRRMVFDRHIAACRDCQNYLGSYKQTMQLSKLAMTQPEDSVPGDVPEALVSAVLAARAKSGSDAP